MALIRRGSRSVQYYESKKVNGRVVTRYVACGEKALQAAREAEARRTLRKQAEAAQRALAKDRWVRHERRVASALGGRDTAIRHFLDAYEREQEQDEEQELRAWLDAHLAAYKRERLDRAQVVGEFCRLVDLVMAECGYGQPKRTLRKRTMDAIETAPAILSAEERARCLATVQGVTARMLCPQTEADVRDFRLLLRAAPDLIFRVLGADLVARIEDMLVGFAYPADQPGGRDALHEWLKRFKDELAAPDAPPLMRLMAARVAVTLLDLSLSEGEYHTNRQHLDEPDAAGIAKSKAHFLESRLDHSNRRFLASVKCLSFVAERPPAAIKVKAVAKAKGKGRAAAAVEVEVEHGPD
jgi:hypothetical protein